MAKSRKSKTKILFIGNSFTARNDLPGMIARLAASHGIEVEHKLLSMGGASLRMHWNKGAAQAEIDRGKYDYVVLQEQSTLPVKNAARMRENVLLFDPVIRKSGSRTVLYMTWARKHAPESQRSITEAYESVGQEIGAIVVPVGQVWEAFLQRHKSPSLYDRDGSHPSPAGSLLAACVFLRAVFRKRLVMIGELPAGLSQDEVGVVSAAANGV